MTKILIVEDDAFFRQSLAIELKKHAQVFQVGSLEEAAKAIEMAKPQIALIDLNLTDNRDSFEGLEVISLCVAAGIVPVVMTSHDSPQVIQNAFERGCAHYFAKSDVQDNLELHLGRLIKSFDHDDFDQMLRNRFLTSDRFLLSQLNQIKNLSLVDDARLLITGPTGVGKTLAAKLAHDLWNPKAPFVHLNLSELPENLIESELFGHKKGSFTGAIADKQGLMAKADGGTLFLDEIGTIPLKLQKKLLKAIEEKTFTPVGATEPQSSNFRLISATCDDLASAIESGDFRVDFYFRIKGVEINLSPIKARRNDIIPLVDFFVASSAKKIAFSKEAQDLLKQYDWPGNVREIEGFVKEVLASAKGLIQAKDLPKRILGNATETPAVIDAGLVTQKMRAFIKEHGLPNLVKAIEDEAFALAYDQTGGKVNEITRELQLSKSMYYRIHNDWKSNREGGYVQ
tara:strand:- start:102317 stop:103687 length:1371 start_codon:yes stop_codon:yes gene_type:complete